MQPLVVPHLLSEAQCHRILLDAEARGFAPATVRTPNAGQIISQIRNNERVDFEDSDLLTCLWSAIQPHLDGASGLDPHLRVYRYDVGQRFKAHKDGAVTVNDQTSQLSFLVYLNDDFEGGQTRFGRRETSFLFEPDIGAGLLFPHGSWHEGMEVTRGRKYVLRTDVLYPSERA